MNWNSLLFSTFIVLISLCVIIESTNQEDIIQCLKNGAEFRQESRLFLAKECWLQTFRDHILCSKMAIFVLIAVSFMYCKAPRMAMVMSVMQFFSCVESQTPPSFIYRRPTEEPQNDFSTKVQQFISEFSWVHASVILSIIVLLFLIFLICYLYKSKHNRCTTLVLEITSGGDCVIVPILNLSLCPSYYKISKPSVKELTVAAFPSCKLFATWSSFQVTNLLTEQSIQIPTTISLSLRNRYKLPYILNQPFNAYVYVTHQGFANILNPPADSSNKTKNASAADLTSFV
ncbi:unnamed protein product [Mytilus edulis]|uniref:Uncharacterized protein n=1 Tax=Mytilus edulis TaxID=6550 RepID=A0A8S3UTC4_MYTED|nr:unnamed protein product [Mytilus edulis]